MLLNRVLWDYGGLVKDGSMVIPPGAGGIYHCVAVGCFEKGFTGAICNLYIDELGEGAKGVDEKKATDLLTICQCQVYLRLEPGQVIALYATSSAGQRLLGGQRDLDPLIELDGNYSPRLTIVRVGG